MNSDKLYQLFSKYHNNTLKLPKGATLDISYDDTNKKIIFIFNNPNDVSYAKSCIEGYIYFFLEEFFELLGLGRTYSGYGNYYPFLLMGVNEIYISPDLSKKTTELLSKITELDYMYFPYKEDAPIGTIYVKHVKFKYEIESSDRDRLVLKNSVKALGAKKEGERLELDYAIDYFQYVQERDKYAESERNYIDVDYLLSTENLLYDPDWQVLYTKTVFM